MIIHKIFFKLSFYYHQWLAKICILPAVLAGLKIGSDSVVGKTFFSWPHQVSIGKNCILESYINFRYDGVWNPGPSIIIDDNVYIGANSEFNICSDIHIGKDALIASGCKFIDHNHGYQSLNTPIRLQPPDVAAIRISNNVWLGTNVIVLKGVKIGYGSIVAAGSVVTKSIPSMEIWGGVPAKKISIRKDEDINNHMRMSGTF